MKYIVFILFSTEYIPQKEFWRRKIITLCFIYDLCSVPTLLEVGLWKLYFRKMSRKVCLLESKTRPEGYGNTQFSISHSFFMPNTSMKRKPDIADRKKGKIGKERIRTRDLFKQ